MEKENVNNEGLWLGVAGLIWAIAFLHLAIAININCAGNGGDFCWYIKNVDSVLNRYQTLITGIIALVVGGLTIRYLKIQIDENKRDKIDQQTQAITAYYLHIILFRTYVKKALALAKSNITPDEHNERRSNKLRASEGIPEELYSPGFLNKLSGDDLIIVLEINGVVKAIQRHAQNPPAFISAEWIDKFKDTIGTEIETISINLKCLSHANAVDEIVKKRLVKIHENNEARESLNSPEE